MGHAERLPLLIERAIRSARGMGLELALEIDNTSRRSFAWTDGRRARPPATISLVLFQIGRSAFTSHVRDGHVRNVFVIPNVSFCERSLLLRIPRASYFPSPMPNGSLASSSRTCERKCVAERRAFLGISNAVAQDALAAQSGCIRQENVAFCWTLGVSALGAMNT